MLYLPGLCLGASFDFDPATETGIPYEHGYAYVGELKYPPDFTHFDYVNPDAPKEGVMRVGEQGIWDSFIPWATKGRSVWGTNFNEDHLDLVHDRLLEFARDELASAYGRLAEGVYVSPDESWIAFRIREGAYWHDGVPVTVDDLVYSFKIYTVDAAPTITQLFQVFDRVEVIGPQEVRYWVREVDRGDRMHPLLIGRAPVLPKHYWETRDASKTSIEPPLTSGAYRIGPYKLGRWVEYVRVDDYWGRDLPVNKGRFNFDVVKWDYFRDDQVRHEAVKGHLIDIRNESVPSRWFRSYDIPAKEAGVFNTKLFQEKRPAGLWWPIFWNLRQERFQDIRVREALWLAYDPSWDSESQQRGFWSQARSFFHGSDLAHSGLPSEAELEILEPIRHLVPGRVFTDVYSPPEGTGNGYTRKNLVRAVELFREAGYEIIDNVMTQVETGEPFEIRLVAVSAALGNSWIDYKQVLKKIGIQATLIAPEVSNWLYRMRSGDFDGGAIWFLPDNTPASLMIRQFSSAAAEQAYSYNWQHMKDPAVDAALAALARARTTEEFLAATRVFDRIMLWNFYFIPGTSKTNHGIVWWDKYSYQTDEPLVRLAYRDTWWWDAEKAARVEAYLGNQSE